MISQGEIYTAVLSRGGQRPVIVVSDDQFNKGRTATVVPCTSQKYLIRKNLPNCVPFTAGQFGLTQDCVAQCEAIATIDQSRLDVAAGPIGTLDDVAFREIIKAIAHVLDADCEPN
jgi:mRNA-degrading endonuclease toxin of MazEF toxin-antitoxin module